jgi:hypothetical protein
MGSIPRSLKSCLHEVCLPTPLIIHMTHFCSLKMLSLSVPTPQKIAPYLKWAWEYAKQILLTICWLVTSFKHHIILQNVTKGLTLGWMLWNDLSHRKWTWVLELGMSGVSIGQGLWKQYNGPVWPSSLGSNSQVKPRERPVDKWATWPTKYTWASPQHH